MTDPNASAQIVALLVLLVLAMIGLGFCLYWCAKWREKYDQAVAEREEECMRWRVTAEELDAYREENTELRRKLSALQASEER